MDLLFGREENAYRESVFGRYFLPIGVGSIAALTVLVTNISVKKPMFSGIHKHLLGYAAGHMLGEYGYHYKKAYFAERDAVLRHYIELHTEDFIEPPQMKYKDVLQPWIPIR